MVYILHIETSTRACSVALGCDGRLVAQRESVGKDYAHSRLLTGFIGEVLRESGILKKALSAVAVSRGPGSYTGLRIGVSTTKGLCYGLDIPLLAVDTLEVLARCGHQAVENRGLIPASALAARYCPMIDARRMEVYHALYDARLRCVEPAAASIITQASFEERLRQQKFFFFGDGAAKCREVISSPNAFFLEDVHPLASGMLTPALQKYKAKAFENTAWFEPAYLKDFVAGKPRVKGLSGDFS